MSESSRRGFLKVAGVGAAAAGVAVVTPSAIADAKAPAKATLPRNAHREIVAHVHDVHSGRMSLMIDGHQVEITDKDLAARLATALHAASPRTVNNAR